MSGGGNFSITGNNGNNTLQGNAGQNVLAGQGGDDTYIIAELGGMNDILVENADAGIDTVRSSVTWVLEDNIENLELYGNASYGTGNDAGNIIIGNGQDNILSGYGGDDRLRTRGSKIVRAR